MAWRIGKCDRCGEPRGDNYACMFRVRALVWHWWVRRVRMWRWWCDDCCIERQQRRRNRINERKL